LPDSRFWKKYVALGMSACATMSNLCHSEV
jgi:hypothetical protein